MKYVVSANNIALGIYPNMDMALESLRLSSIKPIVVYDRGITFAMGVFHLKDGQHEFTVCGVNPSSEAHSLFRS